MPTVAAAASSVPLGARVCPPDSLPLEPDEGCIPLATLGDGHLPARQQRVAQGRPEPLHLSVKPQGESIPLLPGRPSVLERYRMPIEAALGIELMDETPREPGAGPHLLIEGEPGAEVRLLALDGQTERAQVLLVGELEGITVAVRHTVGGPSGPEHVIALYGQLDRPGPEVVNGARLDEGALLGHLLEQPDGIGSLWLQLRKERSDASATTQLSRLISPVVSIATDPRNELPLLKP